MVQRRLALRIDCKLMTILAALLAAVLLSAQEIHKPAKPVARIKPSVSGVVRTKNGTPLAGAHVQLIPIMSSGPSDPRGSAMTGPDGTFHAEVPWTGEYYFGVSLGILTCHGQVQPPLWRRGNILGFTKGEQKTGLIFELAQGGVLQGLVKDDSGKPVAKADVALTVRVRTGEKTYRWVEVGSVQTDEQGNYGFCNLPGRSYYLNVQGSRRIFDSKGESPLISRDFVLTNYSAAKAVDSPQPVQVEDGGVTQIGLTLHDAPTRHVRGHVVLPPNQEFAQAIAVLQHLPPSNSTNIGYHTPIDKDGNYDLAGIAQDKYKVVAMVDTGEREDRPVPGAAQIKKEWTASAEIEVGQKDVVVPTLTPAPRAEIRGQFWDEHGGHLKDSRLILSLMTEDGQYAFRTWEDGRRFPPEAMEVNAEGEFVFHELEPGHYRFGRIWRLIIKRPLQGDKAIYLAAATRAGHDLLKVGFDLQAGDSLDEVAIVIAEDSGSVKGTVIDQAGHSIENALIFIVPAGMEGKQLHRYHSDCSRMHGTFEFSGIAPGDYHVYAFQSPPVSHYVPPWSCGALEQPRPDELKYYEKQANKIHITPSSTLELNLKLIPAE